MSQQGPAILVTGATGYLGGVVAAGLLRDPKVRLVLPVRPQHAPDSVLAHIAAEMASDERVPESWANRLRVIPLPPTDEIPALGASLRRQGVKSVIHCAGCVDYFHAENLNLGNVELT